MKINKTTLLFTIIIIYVSLISGDRIKAAGTATNAQKNELKERLDELNITIPENDKSKEPVKENPAIKGTADAKDNGKKAEPGKKENINKNPDTGTDKKTEEEKKKLEKEREKADWILRIIDNGTHKDRKSAINQILTIKDPGIKKELGNKLADIIKNEAEMEVRIKAITVAGEIKVTEAVPFLVNIINGNEPEDISVPAVYAIKRIGDISAKPALITKLQEQKLDKNTSLIEALIDTMGEFKAAELSAFASEALKSVKTDQTIRELLVLFIGKAGVRESRDALIEIVKDEDETEQIRSFAANSLANLGIKEAIPDIKKVVDTIESYPFNKKRKYNNLYIYCITALVKLGDDEVFPKFLNSLRSDNANVRLKAVNLVKEVKDKRTIDILKYKMNYDPSPKVQSAAREALKELGVDVEAVKKEKTDTAPENKIDVKSEDATKNNAMEEPSGD